MSLAPNVAALLGMYLDRNNRCSAREASEVFDAVHWTSQQHCLHVKPQYDIVTRLSAVCTIKPHLQELQLHIDLSGLDTDQYHDVAGSVAYAVNISNFQVVVVLDASEYDEVMHATGILTVLHSMGLFQKLQVQVALQCDDRPETLLAIHNLAKVLCELPRGHMQHLVLRAVNQACCEVLATNGILCQSRRIVLCLPSHPFCGAVVPTGVGLGKDSCIDVLDIVIPDTTLAELHVAALRHIASENSSRPFLMLPKVTRLSLCCNQPLDTESGAAAHGLHMLFDSAPDVHELSINTMRPPACVPVEASIVWVALCNCVKMRPGFTLILGPIFVRNPVWLPAMIHLLISAPDCKVQVQLDRPTDAMHWELVRRWINNLNAGNGERLHACARRGAAHVVEQAVYRDVARATAKSTTAELVAGLDAGWRPYWQVFCNHPLP
jgi:hypothetical protein